MPRYKRTADEAQLDLSSIEPEIPAQDAALLKRLRNFWPFAALMQFLFLFGPIFKIEEDFDIEDLEAECLQSQPSLKLAGIGLSLLKYVSSHRGLTLDLFDEYTRRQYVAKAPHRNPFGEEEEPAKFNEMDVFTRLRVLQQLSTWTLGNAERIRGMMPADEDHLNWRMEPVGWDRDDNAYYVLDDNRLYRRSDEPVPPPTPKPKVRSRTGRQSRGKQTRSSKRRKIEDAEDEAEQAAEEEHPGTEAGAETDTVMTNGDANHQQSEVEPGYGFTDKTWSLVAITLDEYDDFLGSIFRSRDPNERTLHKRISEDVRPIIEKREEALRQKQLKKLRELENVQRMATAKRSSRLADKAEKEREEREKREAEEKKLRDLRMAHEEEERQRRIEEGHESRRQTREQRIKEREAKRILHEEELLRLQEAEERAASQPMEPSSETDHKRFSARQTKAQREQHAKELAQLDAEDGQNGGMNGNGGFGKWYFDCSICGLHGENLDDGTHSLACDRCNVWQHSRCHGFSPKQAEKEGFVFICKSCKKLEREAAGAEDKPKIPPLKLGRRGTSSSPNGPTEAKKLVVSRPSAEQQQSPAQGQVKSSGLPEHLQRQLDGVHIPRHPRPSPGPFGQITNAPSPPPGGFGYPPIGNFAPNQHQQPVQSWQSPPYQPAPAMVSASRPHSSNAGYSVAASPSPAPPNGHAATTPGSVPYLYPIQLHGQQHHYAHQQAVASAGGHPPYHQYGPASPQYMANGHGPRAQGPPPVGQHPMNYAAQSAQQHYYQQQALPATLQQHYPPRPGSAHTPQPSQPPWPQNGVYYQQQPHQQQRAPSQPPQQPYLANGFQSPTKTTAKVIPPSSSPSAIPHSPRTHLPPPSTAASGPASTPTQSAAARSPMKSSTAQAPQPADRSPTASTNGPSPRQYKQHVLDATPRFPTPSAIQASPAGPTANGIVADGMAGPWEEGSRAIPQKHDQAAAPSPLPTQTSVNVSPSAAGVLSTPGAVMAGVPKLAPSPQASANPVPVKKTLDISGTDKVEQAGS